MHEGMHRRLKKGGWEQDAFSKFGKKYFIWRPGVRARAKADHNRRVRRAARQNIYGD